MAPGLGSHPEEQFNSLTQMLVQSEGDSAAEEECVVRVIHQALEGMTVNMCENLFSVLKRVITVSRGSSPAIRNLAAKLLGTLCADGSNIDRVSSAGGIDFAVRCLRLAEDIDDAGPALACIAAFSSNESAAKSLVSAGVLEPTIKVASRVVLTSTTSVTSLAFNCLTRLCSFGDAEREAFIRWGGADILLKGLESRRDQSLLPALETAVQISGIRRGRVELMKRGGLAIVRENLCSNSDEKCRMAAGDLGLRLANTGLTIQELLSLSENTDVDSCASVLGEHVSRTWRRLMSEFASMIKSSRPAPPVLKTNLNTIRAKYLNVFHVLGSFINILPRKQQRKAFIWTRGELTTEQAASLRQAVSYASLQVYQAVLPDVENCMVEFNDIIEFSFFEVLADNRPSDAMEWNIDPTTHSSSQNSIQAESASNSGIDKDGNGSETDDSLTLKVASAMSTVRDQVEEVLVSQDLWQQNTGFMWLGRLESSASEEFLGTKVSDAVLGTGTSGPQFELQPFDYDKFVHLMKLPQATELRNMTRNFVNELLARPRLNLEEVRHDVIEFVGDMSEQLADHPLWQGESVEYASCVESVERYVTLRLHQRVFASGQESRIQDAELHLRIAALQFVKPDHLDIKPSRRNLQQWRLAQLALCRMAEKATPRDKLHCVLQCAQSIYNLQAADGQECEPLSADEFLPILIYQLIRTNPPQLQSSIDYISSLRHPALMASESAYFFTHFVGAVYFLKSLDASQLSIDPLVFQQLLAQEEENIQSPVTPQNQSSYDQTGSQARPARIRRKDSILPDSEHLEAAADVAAAFQAQKRISEGLDMSSQSNGTLSVGSVGSVDHHETTPPPRAMSQRARRSLSAVDEETVQTEHHQPSSSAVDELAGVRRPSIAELKARLQSASSTSFQAYSKNSGLFLAPSASKGSPALGPRQGPKPTVDHASLHHSDTSPENDESQKSEGSSVVANLVAF